MYCPSQATKACSTSQRFPPPNVHLGFQLHQFGSQLVMNGPAIGQPTGSYVNLPFSLDRQLFGFTGFSCFPLFLSF